MTSLMQGPWISSRVKLRGLNLIVKFSCPVLFPNEGIIETDGVMLEAVVVYVVKFDVYIALINSSVPVSQTAEVF